MTAERVMAYVDGELTAADTTAFEAQLAGDEALRRAVQRERELRAALAAAYEPVLAEAVPPSLQALLAAPEVVDLAQARERRRRWALPEWVAMAACLALGVALGAAVVSHDAGDPLLARGALDRQLAGALAGQPVQEGVAVGLTFAARDGRWCRSFTLDGSAGVACKGDRGWVVQALSPAAPAAPSAPAAYRQATSALPAALLQQIDAMRAGDALDAAAERAARDGGWVPRR